MKQLDITFVIKKTHIWVFCWTIMHIFYNWILHFILYVFSQAFLNPICVFLDCLKMPSWVQRERSHYCRQWCCISANLSCRWHQGCKKSVRAKTGRQCIPQKYKKDTNLNFLWQLKAAVMEKKKKESLLVTKKKKDTLQFSLQASI